jgi:competence protein ComEC
VPLFWLSLAFSSGMLLSATLSLPPAVWWGAGGVAFLLGVATRFHSSNPGQASRNFPFSNSMPVFMLAAALLVGAGRYASSLPRSSPDAIAWFSAGQADYAPPVLVEGVLDRPPDRRDSYTNLTLRVEGVSMRDGEPLIPISGLLLAKVLPGEDWHYGDRLRLKGALETPPDGEGFSYRLYLARKGILVYMPWAEVEMVARNQGSPFLFAIYALKEMALKKVYEFYPDPEASLLAGILLGVESGIPQPVQAAFKATGTSHIIAISGFNMTIIAALCASLFGRLFGKRGGGLAAIAGISIYTILVGANAAVVRAAIMGGFGLFARQVGRRQDGLNTLALVGAIMALFNPYVLWDVGFQLSFAATLGLLLYAQPMADAFIRVASIRLPSHTVQKLAGPVGEYVLFTFAAQLTTLPVLAYHFGKISLAALVANPLILPAQPAVMMAGGLAVMLGLAWQPLGQLAAYLAWPFVVYTIRLVEFFARLPSGEIVLGELAFGFVILFYAVLFGATFLGARLASFKPLFRPAALLGFLGVVTLLVWRAVFSAPDGRLHLTVLDVSTTTASGDAVLIQTPAGRSLLIGGGPSVTLLSDGLGRRLPVADRQIDWLVVAAHGDDQVAALPRVLERYPAAEVLWAGSFNSSRSDRNLDAYLTTAGVPVTTAQAGHSLDLGEGCQLRILTSGERGAILLLEWDNFQAVLPLGARREDFALLDYGRALGPVTVLMLADGGHFLTNPQPWIHNLQPQAVLLSVAGGDRRGLPSSQILQALDGYTLLRTDMNGWIHIITDGERMWLEVEKN